MSVAAFLGPFVLLVLLVVVFRTRLWLAGLTAFLLASGLWGILPGMAAGQFLAPLVRALLVSFEIALILLGAIAFLEFMKASGLTSNVKQSLQRLTGGDPLLLALMLAWLFCAFLEGAAGFGAPAAVVAPLLLSLGFPALTAATLPLIGDSTAVPFGAVGTPLRMGLPAVPTEGVAVLTAGFHVLTGLVPVLFICQLVSKHADSWLPSPAARKTGRPGAALASLAGLCLTLPALALASVGPEFPSLLGALMGLVLFTGVMAFLSSSGSSPTNTSQRFTLAEVGSFLKSFSPYFLLGFALLLGKGLLGVQKWSFEIDGIPFGVAQFQPGAVFLLIIFVLRFASKKFHSVSLWPAFQLASSRLPGVFFSIFFMAAMAQYSMAFFNITNELEHISSWHPVWPYVLVAIAPFVGVLGAFVSGSATVANLLFGGVLFQLCTLLQVSPTLVLSLHLVGAGAGNMIALQNLAAVQATIGLQNCEREMLTALWRPCFAVATLCSVLGLVAFQAQLP